MKPRFGVLTGATVVLLAIFGIVDAAAHFSRYQYGETFSAFVWSLEDKYPAIRFMVGSLIAVLFTHLVFHLP